MTKKEFIYTSNITFPIQRNNFSTKLGGFRLEEIETKLRILKINTGKMDSSRERGVGGEGDDSSRRARETRSRHDTHLRADGEFGELRIGCRKLPKNSRGTGRR